MESLESLLPNSSSFAIASNVDENEFDSHFFAVIQFANYIYLSLSVFGIVLNSYVLARLTAQGYKDGNKFVDGSGMPLAIMAVADLLSLILIFLIIILGSKELHISTRLIHCKMSLFLIHTMTGVSMWCWMLASGLRYMAVYHPFSHMRRWRQSLRFIVGIVFISTTTNCWLLNAVNADDNRCVEADFIFNHDRVNRALHVVEIGWSYLAPTLLTSIMDARVFLTQPPRIKRIQSDYNIRGNTARYRNRRESGQNGSFFGSSQTITLTLAPRTAVRRPQAAIARAAVGRWLFITSVDLLLNAPDTIIRLLILVGLLGEDCAIQWKPQESNITLFVLVIARLLYFAQFSFNALFLTVVIYRLRSGRQTTTQQTPWNSINQPSTNQNQST